MTQESGTKMSLTLSRTYFMKLEEMSGMLNVYLRKGRSPFPRRTHSRLSHSVNERCIVKFLKDSHPLYRPALVIYLIRKRGAIKKTTDGRGWRICKPRRRTNS